MLSLYMYSTYTVTVLAFIQFLLKWVFIDFTSRYYFSWKVLFRETSSKQFSIQLIQASAGILNPFTLRDPLEIIVCYSDTFQNNLGIKQKFTKHLKESCWLTSLLHLSLNYFAKNAFVRKIFPKIVRSVLATLSVNGLRRLALSVLRLSTFIQSSRTQRFLKNI